MIEIIEIAGIGEIKANDNLGAIIANCLRPYNITSSDIIVVTQKIVSKSEGQLVFLKDIKPSQKAIEIAHNIGKDPRMVELVLSQSSEIIRAQRGVLITRHKLGFVMANAGIDCSNVGNNLNDESALLLPENPDASAFQIADQIKTQSGVYVGVIISDSFGRPWRNGVVNVAIGSAGLPTLYDKRGEIDRDGRVLRSTTIAYGDLIASAAGLAMGEGAEGLPVVLLRGLKLKGENNNAASLIRPPTEDLFR